MRSSLCELAASPPWPSTHPVPLRVSPWRRSTRSSLREVLGSGVAAGYAAGVCGPLIMAHARPSPAMDSAQVVVVCWRLRTWTMQ